MFDGTARGKKELKRAKQARQQPASGSDCNLAVNRMLTTMIDLPMIDTLWLRRQAMWSNATNCSDGVSAISNQDQMKRYDPDPMRRYDPAASVDTSRNSRWSTRWRSALNISVHDDVTRLEKVSDDEPERSRRHDTLGEDVRRWTTTFPFRGRLAEKFHKMSNHKYDRCRQSELRQRSE